MSKAKLVSVLWTIVISVIIGGAGYILSVGDVWKVSWHGLVNVLVFAALNAIVAGIKLVGTNEETGTFMGTQIRQLPTNE